MGATPGGVRGWLTDASYATGWAAVRALPEPAAAALFRRGGSVAARRDGRGVQRLRANLARVAPDADLDALLAAALQSYARYWREVFRLPVTPLSRIVAGTESVNDPRFRDAAAAGRGLVLALTHSGNWDAAGAWAVATGVRFTTVAERLKPESLYDRFVAFRESVGMQVLPLTGGPRPSYDILVEQLAAGGNVALLADRDLTPRGVDVEFFGATARMPAGPAALALRTSSALMPVSLSFREDGWRLEFHPEVPHTDIATMTQQLADVFAKGIAASPQDWHMLQRLWLDDLAPADPRRMAADSSAAAGGP
ncbi:MAG TPA: phosphatidylinositol mannoside acyltransferase [Mycobacteriales bacterium]|nr:phosphatidylinositol mannoside acyltransferase [Mycobacteriales bacterium]